MKRLLASLSAGLLLTSIIANAAFAANATPTPVVPPTETGENSEMQQQIVDMARIKPGQCTATAAGSGAAAGTQTVTCNGASGVITTVALTMNAAAGINTVTVTDDKVQVGDIVMAIMDNSTTPAAQTEVLAVNAIAAGSFNIQLIQDNTTACGVCKVYFTVFTKGNPN
jgi:hypothetical protein